MAHRRRNGMPRPSSITKEGQKDEEEENVSVKEEIGKAGDSSSSTLAAKAIRASSDHRDSSALSSAYTYAHSPALSSSSYKDSASHGYSVMKSSNESKSGFWGVLARKAKAILEDDSGAQQSERSRRMNLQMLDPEPGHQRHNAYHTPDSIQNVDSPKLQKGLDVIASSINYIGGTISNALEEGLTVMENRTADIIHETRKVHIRKKGNSSGAQNQSTNVCSTLQHPPKQAQMQSQIQTDLDMQLKASRDVAMAMAAKAKLLLRELKTVKADLAFAKERCAQLEEENRFLRENRDEGDSLEDDDLIRLQLETLLTEKARLAHENSIYARENRFLREVVEYHQLTMQDVVYLDEGIEEVSEVYTQGRTPVTHSPVTPDSLPRLSCSPSVSPGRNFS